MKTKNLTFCIDKIVAEKLDKYSEDSMIAKSRLVTKLLEGFFFQEELKKIKSHNES